MSDDVVYTVVANTAGFTGPIQAAAASTAELVEFSKGLQAQIAAFQGGMGASTVQTIAYADAIQKSSRAMAEDAAIAKIATDQQISLTAAKEAYTASLLDEARARDAAFASIQTMNAGLAEEIQARRVGIAEIQAQAAAERKAAAADAEAAAARSKLVASSSALLANYAPEFAQLEKIRQARAALNDANAAGLLVSAEQQAQFAVASAKLAEEEMSLLKATGGADALSLAMGRLSNASSRTMYSFSALVTDALSGQFGRMQREIAALVNELGLLRAAFALFGWVTIAAGIAIIAAAFIEGAKRAEEFEKAIVLSGNAAGATSEKLMQISDAAGGSDKALLELVKSGKIVGDSLPAALAATNEYMELTGVKAEKAAQEVIKFATAPTPELIKLNDQLHVLTPAIADQIVMLEKQGDAEGAVALKIQAFENSLKMANKEVQDSGGYISSAVDWLEKMAQKFTDAQTAAWKFFEGLGSGSDTAQIKSLQLEGVIVQIAAKLKELSDPMQAGAIAAATTQVIANINAEINTLLRDRTAKEGAAAAAGALAQSNAQLSAGMLQAGDEADKLAKTIDKNSLSFRGGNVALVQHTEALILDTLSAKMNAEGKAELTLKLIDYFAADMKAATAADASAKAHKDAADASRQATKDLNVYNEALKREETAQEAIDKILEKSADKGDPIAAIWKQAAANVQVLEDAQAALLDQDQIAIDHAVTLAGKTQAQTKYVNDLAAANAALTAYQLSENDAAQQHVDVLGNEDTWMQKIHDDYQKEEQLAGMTTTQRRVYNEVLQAETEYQKLLNAAKGKGIEISPEVIAQLKAEADAHVKNMEAIEQAKQVEEELQRSVESGFDSIGNSIAQFATGGIHTMKDFEKSLLGDFTQFIAQMIEQMLKLTIFNGIINSMFESSLPTMGLGSMLGGFASLFSGGGMAGFASGFMNGGAGGAGGMLSNASTLFGAGNAGYGMLTGSASLGASSLFGSLSGTMGTSDALGLVPDYAGTGIGFSGEGALQSSFGAGGANAPGVYTPSALGEGLGIAGGLYAGYNEYNAAGGGFAGLAGGAAYGIGSLALGGGLSSLALGGTFGAGMAGSLGAGAAAGAGMEGLAAAIPVVGWIALAAMALNMITGGGLFGTSYKPTGAQGTDLSIGADGTASLTNIIEESKKKALFAGHSTKDVNFAATADQQKAVDQIAASMQSAVDAATKTFGVDTANLLGASFNSFKDKKGVTTTTGTVAGMAIAGESQQDWATREIDDSIIAAIDKLGGHAMQTASALQGDVKALDAFTQGAVMIEANLKDVNKQLMGEHGNTFDSVLAFVKGLQQQGETLVQTYQRLVQAAAQYQQFVQQFAPAKVYVDSFEASLAAINDQWAKNKAQADALAQAAGAQGASQEDLLNIQKSTIAQVAQLVAQMEASAQQLAFSLGLTTQGSLDQVTQQINALESKAKGATSSVSGFGNTIQQVSQQATAAMSLLLGNLSPLNDQEKLQAALAGLRNGTATVDDVLTIGRRLYASSEAYTELFNSVKGYAGAGHGGAAGSGRSGSSGTPASSGLSTAEQAELKTLLAEQAAMQKAARVGQDQTLVTQIAEIASAKSEDFHDVLKDMGISESDLLKELGLKDDASLTSMVAYIQAQKDSDKNNTTSIVGAITMLPQEIADAIMGKPVPGQAAMPGYPGKPVPGTGTSPGAPPSSPGTGAGGGNGGPGGGRGRFGNGGVAPSIGERTMTDADAKAFGDYVAKALSPLVSQFVQNMPRSARVALPR